MATIPVVDLSSWSDGEPANRKRIASELTEACRRVGFVYVRNHGVPDDILREAFTWAGKLFDLPLEKKMLAPHPPGMSVHRGYSWPGLEKVSQIIYADGEEEKQVGSRRVPDVKESYEIGSEVFAQQPNVWIPEDVLPGFREFTTAFYSRCFEVAKELLRALALGLGLDDEEFFVRFHSGLNNQLRLLHYPPVEVEKLAKGEVERMPAHSDWGTITMLFQDNGGGLQVEDPNQHGHFVDATPMDGALILNVGDLLMRWSNDYLKSTLHRVTLPPLSKENGVSGKSLMTQSRYSIPYFVAPDPTAIVECLAVCANEADNSLRYPPITQEEYAKMRARGQYL
ncbi:hypothetical protein F5B22DRAFT_508917 [Xylaria bambusicola]|uniref:uncharacterized protein n=1 Tax=Xylaria bambusicola TaxID=326684 RepID=UPI00200744A6|nr:uncharacterized protein F5B22DRAFT_508917 [Xylaria bambusicola]KAI0521894.1 hypothetical protein F5B22DRAFT_508917 [Xylaria bambusicola]